MVPKTRGDRFPPHGWRFRRFHWSRISPTSMMSGSSRTACFMATWKSITSMSDFTLVDQALVRGVHELDWVFDRQDVTIHVVIDPVEHRRNRRTLSGPGHSRQQHHALIELAEALPSPAADRDFRKGRNEPFTLSSHHADFSPSWVSRLTRNRHGSSVVVPRPWKSRHRRPGERCPGSAGPSSGNAELDHLQTR